MLFHYSCPAFLLYLVVAIGETTHTTNRTNQGRYHPPSNQDFRTQMVFRCFDSLNLKVPINNVILLKLTWLVSDTSIMLRLFGILAPKDFKLLDVPIC